MDFKETEIGDAETITIFSHMLAEVLNAFSCHLFCHASLLLSYKNKHLIAAAIVKSGCSYCMLGLCLD